MKGGPAARKEGPKEGPRRSARVPLEHDEQCALHRWLLARDIPHFAIPNGAILGGHNRYAQLARLRAEGFAPGAPDLILLPPVPKAPHLRCAIELKRTKGGQLSPAQRGVHPVMRKCDWVVIVARGWKHAAEELEGLGY